MIEVPLTSLLMLAIASFVIGMFAADIFCKMAAKKLKWRITYEGGCDKCGNAAGVYVVQHAECIHCIFNEADKLARDARNLLDESLAECAKIREEDGFEPEPDPDV